MSLEFVTRIIPVLSGKGGVGKSTVAVQLALSLHQQGFKVGLLDIDLTGPSIPRMLNIETKQVHQASTGWIPVHVDDRLCVMSIAFLLGNKNDAVVWRGPKKNAMIKQFLMDVAWGHLDVLLVDTPPGTSDEHLSLFEFIPKDKLAGAVIVTTPQNISLQDVRKELSFCLQLKVKILGLVENMSGFVCACCV